MVMGTMLSFAAIGFWRYRAIKLEVFIVMFWIILGYFFVVYKEFRFLLLCFGVLFVSVVLVLLFMMSSRRRFVVVVLVVINVFAALYLFVWY